MGNGELPNVARCNRKPDGKDLLQGAQESKKGKKRDSGNRSSLQRPRRDAPSSKTLAGDAMDFGSHGERWKSFVRRSRSGGVSLEQLGWLKAAELCM